MNKLDQKLSKLRIDVPASKQTDVLRDFENLSEDELLELTSTGYVKSTEAGMVILHLGYKKLFRFKSSLLEFLQDCNWPAAGYVADLFISAGKDVIPDIQKVFRNSPDPIWSYWILVRVVSEFDNETLRLIKKDLLQLIVIADKEGASIEALRLFKLIDDDNEYEKYYRYLEGQFSADNYWLTELKSL